MPPVLGTLSELDLPGWPVTQTDNSNFQTGQMEPKFCPEGYRLTSLLSKLLLTPRV